MNRKLIRLAACLITLLLVSTACLAEAAEAPQASNGQTIAIILPADDGFQSLLENNTDITEILTAYITVAEQLGNRILLQGSRNNNNPSSLQYRTGSGTIDWSAMPQKGNAQTLSSTIGSLNKDGYNDYDKIIIVTGHFGGTVADDFKRIEKSAPTYIFQLLPFDDGSSLLLHYSKINKYSISEQGIPDIYGIPVYKAVSERNGEQVDIHLRTYDAVTSVQVLDDMLKETLYDGSIDIQPESFSLPATLVDELYLLLQSDSLANVKLISPDGTRYAITTTSEAQGDTLRSPELSLNGQQLGLISLKNVKASGLWHIENPTGVSGAKLYYKLKKSTSEQIQASSIVDPQLNETELKKGTEIFKVFSSDTVRDLFALYPALRIQVTDTLNNAINSENIADVSQPDQVALAFTKGGDHSLTFRLMNGDEEILRQTIQVRVTDNKPVFNRTAGEEIVVYPDTLESNDWNMSMEGWFSDADNDPITINMKGGDTDRVSFKDNTLTLHLPEGILDGSVDVYLTAISDSAETEGSVRLVWRSLTTQIKNIRLTLALESEKEGEPFTKRTKVKARAQMDYNGPDEEKILNELLDCEAVIKDQDGNIVTNVTFNDKTKEFVSDAFALPDMKGQYYWTLSLTSEAGHLPVWSIEKKTDRVNIENAVPVANPEALSDENYGEQYAFDINDWSLKIPENLITDPDNDPISYDILVKGENGTDSIHFSNFDEVQPVYLPAFGDYTITITGKDNDGILADEIVKKIQIKDLKQMLEGIKGVYSVEPEEELYRKRATVNLNLKLSTQEWTEKQTEAITNWLSNCLPEISVGNDIVSDARAAYDADAQTFTVQIQVPEKKGDYRCRIALKNRPEEQPEVLVNGSDPFILKVENHQPELMEETEFGDINPWVMKAEEYEGIVIPAGAFMDSDNDQIEYNLKLYKTVGTNEETIQDEKIGLPYTLHFPAFSFFDLNNQYKAEITATDNDNASESHTIDIKLQNKTLLLLIIGVAVLLLLIILAVILYAMHRKNLPKFGGALGFTQNGEPVSQDIALTPWEKQKHLPLSTFAGAINVLLDNTQWENLKQLEVRPDKNEGFRLHKVSSKNKEDLPYDIGNGLEIQKK